MSLQICLPIALSASDIKRIQLVDAGRTEDFSLMASSSAGLPSKDKPSSRQPKGSNKMGQQIVKPNAFMTHRTPQRLLCPHSPSYRTILICLCSFFALLQWLDLFSVILGPTNFTRQLQINSDRTFQIAVFSDIHYGEDEHSFGPGQDIKSAALMRQVLATEKPDLVVLNGDLITGENTF